MEKLLILTGPTAVGKTALSVKLAKELDAEIISADSMQVYRGMDIGTAKVTDAETGGVPHHLIDILEPTEAFNVMHFQRLAKEAAEKIRAKGRLPLVVGGTGFYIRALLYDTDFTETDEDTAFRSALEEEVRREGDAAKKRLHERLTLLDPVSGASIPEGNVKRVIRALEYFEKTGTPISAHNKRERAKSSPYDFRYFVLTMERQKLYERINLRVERMFAEGLVEEVKRLMAKGVTAEMTSMQGLGYREVFHALSEGRDPEEVREKIKQNTRHFAKRQMTWFQGERDVILIDKENGTKEDDVLLKEILCRL
ncbi:MAG: tRNA (adenosine(37)-N6)-dimethylallyltransferase MiaA [Lachnospiraceae bacterium]|nr:tRNA (adenosine(37)-N6)-dimethylallyltransferase MiaA [Lachnospiraceae bacterium]